MKSPYPESEVCILEKAGIRPTPNRILVTRALTRADGPLSLMELEEKIDTLEKSSVFRVLSLLLERGAVHAVEDGRGIAKYELCRAEGHCSPSHFHAHFYCERCRHTFCLDDVVVPQAALPDGFHANSVNYMIKGICPDCEQL